MNSSLRCGFGAIFVDFGQILPIFDKKRQQDREVPRGTGILLRFKIASQLINELISEFEMLGTMSFLLKFIA